MMTTYGRLIQARRNCLLIGIVLIALGLVVGVLAVWLRSEPLRYPGFTMFVLGLYSTALADFQRRLADTQARLDMKKLMLDARPHSIISMRSDDLLDIDRPCTIHLDRAATVRVMHK